MADSTAVGGLEIPEPSPLEEDIQRNKIEQNTKKLQVVSDIPLEVMCVLGSTSMTVNQILKLAKGSVIELERNIGEPIDLLVNGKLVAKGEVVIVEDKIGLTITDVVRDTSA